MSTAALIRSEPGTDDYTMRRVRELRHEVVGAVSAGDADVFAAIGASSPMRLVCATLGVPRRDWARLSRLAWRGDPDSIEALGCYVDVMVADGCRRSPDDLLADLIGVEAGGDGLTADEIRTIAVKLLAS